MDFNCRTLVYSCEVRNENTSAKQAGVAADSKLVFRRYGLEFRVRHRLSSMRVSWFARSFQAKADVVTQLGHECFLPNPFTSHPTIRRDIF
jgi:hypothetical protein